MHSLSLWASLQHKFHSLPLVRFVGDSCSVKLSGWQQSVHKHTTARCESVEKCTQAHTPTHFWKLIKRHRWALTATGAYMLFPYHMISHNRLHCWMGLVAPLAVTQQCGLTRVESVDMESNTTVQNTRCEPSSRIAWRQAAAWRRLQTALTGTECGTQWFSFFPKVFSSGPAEQLRSQQRENIACIDLFVLPATTTNKQTIKSICHVTWNTKLLVFVASFYFENYFSPHVTFLSRSTLFIF